MVTAPCIAPRITARIAALLLASLLAACASVKNPVTGERELTVMDERAEIAEGAKAHEQVLAEYAKLNNPALQAYVDGVGQKLAAQSHRANLKWTFTVLDSPEVNAFALPGGYIYITRGIMAYLDSEADLAGVLGHEIGHVTARHGAQRATSQARAGVGVFAAVLGGALLEAATGVRGAAEAVGNLAQGAAAGLVARYGREQELQADQLGAEYLARNQFNPANMVDVIQALKDQERFATDAARAAGRPVNEGGGGWLASHPSNDQRLAEIRGTASRLAAGRPAWADDGRQRYLQMMAGVTFGDSREQGVVRGRQFFHEPLGVAITAPAGWRINNDSEALQLVNSAGDAALVMQLVPDKLIQRAGRDHEAILRQGFGATEGRIERLTLGGSLAATSFSGQRRDSKGAVGALEASVVTGPEGRLYVLGRMARDAAARDRARAALREAELSFRPLSAADRSAARPWKLKLVPFPAGGFAQLAAGSPLGANAEAQLRLMNGAYHAEGRTGEPRVGHLVKVIE